MDNDSTQETLKRIEKLLLIIVKAQLGPILAKEMADDRMRKLYELTGSVTANDAAKKLKCSATTVVDAWRRWEQAGLIVKEGRQYQKVL